MSETSKTKRSDGRIKTSIKEVFYGKEDHGILTCAIRLENHNSFGMLCLDEKTGPDFVKSLCEVFGVRDPEALIGMECYTLSCFPFTSEPYEGLEAPSGLRFLISEWRKKHHADAPVSPLVARRERMRANAVSHRSVAGQIERDANHLEENYIDWSK
jgi:hypothetical protein